MTAGQKKGDITAIFFLEKKIIKEKGKERKRARETRGQKASSQCEGIGARDKKKGPGAAGRC